MDALHARLARRIRALADERSLPLLHLADLAGVGRAHLYRVLDGTASPTVAWLAKVADVLEVDVADLLAREPRG